MTISLMVGGTSANTFTSEDIKSISLQQDAGIMNEIIPIDVLTVDVIATSIALFNNWVELEIDGALWCVYWLTDLRKTGTNTYRIVAKSPIVLIDKVYVPPVMYASDNASLVLSALLSSYIPLVTIDSALASLTLTGYCPEQTIRERLQWIMMSLTSPFRVRTSFVRGVIIEPSYTPAGSLSNNHIYYAPSFTQQEVVTKFKTVYHQYAPIASPSGYDDVVQVGANYYQHTSIDFVLTNTYPEASFATYNEYGVSNATLITVSNYIYVGALISNYYFYYTRSWSGRFRWLPGFMVGAIYTIPVTKTTTTTGFLKSAKYIFGSQGIAVDAEFICYRE